MMKTAEQLIRNAKNRIQEVSVDELFEAMENHKTILIDVREPDEFQAAAIDRAINYPRGVLEMRIHQHPLASHHCDTLQALEHLKDQTIYLLKPFQTLHRLDIHSNDRKTGYSSVIQKQTFYLRPESTSRD